MPGDTHHVVPNQTEGDGISNTAVRTEPVLMPILKAEAERIGRKISRN
jgi:hypothetical protein